ncbi:two-component system sensor histidine kinase NatK [Bacillus carboniphilus]|uniref:Two-component system sensor histidine kinase NatK n=1 Tax=Bacillus carboniphilus TaxID=86663 RepID=A0ABN0W039_9BACI
MRLHIQDVISLVIHVMVAISFLIKDTNLLHIGVVSVGMVGLVLLKVFRKQKPSNGEGWFHKTSFQILQVLLLIGVLVTASTMVGILGWMALFLTDFIREDIRNWGIQKDEAIKRLEEEREVQNSIFRTIRSQRHDFLKHISVVQHLLEEDKLKDARAYFASLLGEYETMNMAIKGEEGHIAAILHQYQRLCEEHQVSLTYDFQVPVSSLPLTLTDQTKLLSNLLENSFEAAREYQGKESTATIECRSSLYGGIIVLEIKNSTLPLDKEILDHLFERFDLTSKHKGHEGLGTYIIANLVKQYHGNLSFKYASNELLIKIKFPLIVEEK